MIDMVMNPRIHEIAAEVVASLERIQSLLTRLGAFDERQDFHRRRDLRLTEEDIRRILARTRAIVSEAPPEAAAWVNDRVDEIELKLELAGWIESVCDQARALAQEFVRLLVEAMDLCEAYATEQFHALKRLAREPGNEHLIPHVQEMQRALRHRRRKKRERAR